MGARVLVVDDNEEHARVASRVLSRDGYAVRTAFSAGDALEMLQADPVDLVVTDIDMPVMDGLELLSEIKGRWRDQPVVMMSGVSSIDLAVRAVQRGAADFVQKPIDFERLREAVSLALMGREEDVPLNRPVAADVDLDLVGESPPIVGLKRLIKQIARTDCRVLIQGENGTGKELIANALHLASARKSGPFVKVNCGALTSTLLESELFGHEKGAFTGAFSRRRGRFEVANGGTLLLDEVGELSLEAQVRLLRVIQEGEFERVGGSQTIRVDVRLIAATNKDLFEMVCEGRFREDLYYRLNVVSLHAPALRNRRSDIPLLVRHMLSKAGLERHVRISEETMKALVERPYPGNVRELQNLIERLAILLPGEEITPAHLNDLGGPPVRLRDSQPEQRRAPAIDQPGVSYRDRLLQLEMRLITEALEEHGNSKSAAAQSLGTDKSFFYRKCRQFGID
jgi:DNA-binding NtrC family response regulator